MGIPHSNHGEFCNHQGIHRYSNSVSSLSYSYISKCNKISLHFSYFKNVALIRYMFHYTTSPSHLLMEELRATQYVLRNPCLCIQINKQLINNCRSFMQITIISLCIWVFIQDYDFPSEMKCILAFAVGE